ncbi:hypothetical protein ALC57_02576 [Trachymyrmex cornetzi]|uniref:Uncharacterized protein n=1 Tax=Trachymyrmex cornetzi TaxID=471704 RepID=A0A151JNG9_9HYME|nr:hypothetical protein ALC57_02576 [Trachymyrmex cornetzi]
MRGSLKSKFDGLQCDPYFSEYIELFKRMLLAKEPKDVPATEKIQIEISNMYVLSRAKMSTVFVARQMSGVDSAGIRCIDQQLEVHLMEIKECLETSMIPLGQLRIGSYRVVLFKAIANRSFPAAFRIVTELLGKSNVFTYQNRHESEKISLSRDYQSTIYPTKLMKSNFILDLMDIPRDLIPIASPRSKLYTIKKITYNETYCY